jgi:hypothetical protein
MATSKDLRREVSVAKMQTLIDAVDGIERGTLADNCTTTNITASLTEVTLQAANVLRSEVVIQNNSNGILYVLCGAGVTSSNYNWRLKRGDHLTIDKFRGELKGIFTNATGFAMVTEEYYT